MAIYYVDSAATGANNGTSWTDAWVSPNSLPSLASNDIVYISSTSVDAYAYAAHKTITGPTSSSPAVLISVTSGTTTYAKSASNQFDTSTGAYDLTFDGAFALYGLRAKSGRNVHLHPDFDEVFFTSGCTLSPAAGAVVSYGATTANMRSSDLTIDLSRDTSNTAASCLLCNGNVSVAQIIGLTFVGAQYRTGVVFDPNGNLVGVYDITAGDFSGFTNATLCELIGSRHTGAAVFSNCKTAATWGVATLSGGTTSTKYTLTNCGPADAPTHLYEQTGAGVLISSTDIYRTGGATIEGVACSWLITTTSVCSEHSPFYTPWRYGTLSSTGSKTFEMFITNDTADLTDAEIWLEVEYKSESTEAIWALATDQRATITTTAAAQTDDTASTWNGSGPSFTYKQKLSVTATVNQVGQYRVRVAVGKTSVAGSAYLYLDPAVTVS